MSTNTVHVSCQCSLDAATTQHVGLFHIQRFPRHRQTFQCRQNAVAFGFAQCFKHLHHHRPLGGNRLVQSGITQISWTARRSLSSAIRDTNPCATRQSTKVEILPTDNPKAFANDDIPQADPTPKSRATHTTAAASTAPPDTPVPHPYGACAPNAHPKHHTASGHLRPTSLNDTCSSYPRGQTQPPYVYLDIKATCPLTIFPVKLSWFKSFNSGTAAQRVSQTFNRSKTGDRSWADIQRYHWFS